MRENDYKPLYKHAQSSISKAQQNSTLSPKMLKTFKTANLTRRRPVESRKKKQFCVDSNFCMKLNRHQRTLINCSEKVFWRLNLLVSLVFKKKLKKAWNTSENIQKLKSSRVNNLSSWHSKCVKTIINHFINMQKAQFRRLNKIPLYHRKMLKTFKTANLTRRQPVESRKKRLLHG